MRRAVVVIVLAIASRAQADPLAFGPLDEDKLRLQLVSEIELAPGMFARPLSLAPDAWWGVTSRLTIGVIHSDASIDRIAPQASLCVRTDRLLCTHTYRGSGLDVLYRTVEGVTPHVRFLVRDTSPMKPALTLGVQLSHVYGRIALATDPFLQVGMANTDRGNRGALWLPVIASARVVDELSVELHTGWNSDLAVMTDGWHVPAELAVRYRGVNLDASVGFGFTSILGPQNTPKERLVMIALGWRT